jgi:hypothetical protein
MGGCEGSTPNYLRMTENSARRLVGCFWEAACWFAANIEAEDL